MIMTELTRYVLLIFIHSRPFQSLMTVLQDFSVIRSINKL